MKDHNNVTYISFATATTPSHRKLPTAEQKGEKPKKSNRTCDRNNVTAKWSIIHQTAFNHIKMNEIPSSHFPITLYQPNRNILS